MPNNPPSQPPNRPQGASAPSPRPAPPPARPQTPQTPAPPARADVPSQPRPLHPTEPSTIPDVPAKEPETYPPPKDFKLAEPGSKDYVAGQPVDEEELAETEEAARAKADPDNETHSQHYREPTPTSRR
jgi:hypothetical protein